MKMKALFSQRHKTWIYDTEKIKKNNLTFNSEIRTSLFRILNKYSKHDAWEGTFHSYDEYTDLALDYMKTILGIERFNRKDVFSKQDYINMNLESLIKHGYPSDVLDCVEAYMVSLLDNNDGKTFNLVQEEINSVLRLHDSYWRFIETTAVLLDSSYITEEIILKQNIYMSELGANGVLDEINNALSALNAENYKVSIQESQKALESAIKTVIKDDSPANLSELLKKLRNLKLLPGQYVNFADNFFKLIGTVNAGRSQPGGAHGQGSQIVEINRNEAELVFNLTAVFNKYLLELFIQGNGFSHKIDDKINNYANISDDELPF